MSLDQNSETVIPSTMDPNVNRYFDNTGAEIHRPPDLVTNSASNYYYDSHYGIQGQEQYQVDEQQQLHQQQHQQMYDPSFYYQQPMYYNFQQQDPHIQQENTISYIQPEEQRYENVVQEEPPMHIPMEHQQREPVDGGNEAQPTYPPAVVPFNDHELEENILMPIERLVLGESKDCEQTMTPQQPASLPPLPSMQNERSEAAGSDRRDESVMGPPPTSGLSPPPTTRPDVAGSDAIQEDRQKPKQPVSSLNRRSRPKDDYTYDSRKSSSEDDRGDNDSVFSQSSEAIQQHQGKQPSQHGKRGNNIKQRYDSRRHHDSSSDVDDRVNPRNIKSRHGAGQHDGTYGRLESYKSSRGERDRQLDRDRDYRFIDDKRNSHMKDKRHDRTQYKDDRSFREDRSFRDDRSYYGADRDYRRDMGRDSKHGTARKDRDRGRYGSSRPSSRTGSYYPDDYRSGDWGYRRAPEFMDQSLSYMNQSLYQPHPFQPVVHPQMAAYYFQQHATPLDPTLLETFRKNWEYYERNPKEKENLRITNPVKYERLMMYYQSYSHLLPASSDRPSSRASVHSGQSSVQQTLQIGSTSNKQDADYKWLQENVSTILPPDSSRDISTFQPTLEGSHIEGQIYMGSAANGPLISEPQPQHQLAPLKFSSPCVKGVFCPRGSFLKVNARSPFDGQTATVELLSLQFLLGKENKELKNYPGPLVPGQTHKGDVIKFCQSKITAAKKNRSLIDRDSYVLIWDLMILLMRQKNAIDGSDIAELLLKDKRDMHLLYEKKLSNKMLQGDLNDDDNCDDDHDENAPETPVVDSEKYRSFSTERGTNENGDILPFAQEMERNTAKFRDYMLFGNKKEGLDFAIKHGLWGHALFLASKMDERTYSNVMLRFANGLAVNDPLQTLYQLMSGRQPIAVKECADQNWGDWRPHLAMILSNGMDRSELFRKSVLTLGDTLMEKGLIFGAHFCYIVANIEFGTYSSKNSKLVLIGSDHHLPFEKFASNEAIQCTEIFEFAQRLSNPTLTMSTLTYYKFLYITRLIDAGRAHTALHYIEELSKALCQNPNMIEADKLDPRTLVHQLLGLAEHLKYLDPMYTTGEGEMTEMGDPKWLTDLSSLAVQIASSDWTNLNSASPSGEHTGSGQSYDQQDYNHSGENQHYDQSQYYQQQQDDYQHQQNQNLDYQEWNDPTYQDNNAIGSSQPVSLDQGHPSPQESSVDPSSVESSSQVTPVHAQLQPPSLGFQPASMPPPPSTDHSEPNYFSGVVSPPPPVPEIKEPAKLPEAKQNSKNEKKAKKDEKKAPSLIGNFLGKFLKSTSQAHLPEDKDQSITWDEKTKRWVDKNASEDEASLSSVAPPSDADLSRSNSSANFGAETTISDPVAKIPLNNNTLAPPMGGNRYAGSFGKRYGSVGRIDVFKNAQGSAPMSQMAPMLPSLAPFQSDGLLLPEPVSELATDPGDNSHQTASDQVDVVEVQEANTAPPLMATPMFFNPNQLGGGVPTTRRNKYT